MITPILKVGKWGQRLEMFALVYTAKKEMKGGICT